MNQESYLLKWKFFHLNVPLTLEQEAAQNRFSDVTLVSDDMIPFKVHKFVLSANSPVLKDILVNNPHPEPIIYLEGIQSQELKSLLQLMYFGEGSFYNHQVESLVKVIEGFKLIGFQKDLISKISSEMIEKRRNRTTVVKQKTKKSSTRGQYDESNSGIRYECNQCDYTASQQSNLKVHKQSIHEGIRHECSQCNYLATTKGHLRSHQKRIHSSTMINLKS